MVNYKGKFRENMYHDKANSYDEVHFDMLWFIMDLCKIQRFTTLESFREFLVRLFLIRDKEFNNYALEIIDYELLIDGYLNDQYFELHIQDLINLIGFATSSANYNIKDTLNDFVEQYQFRPPNISFSKKEDEEKTYTISADTLAYALMGLGNLLHIEGCTLKFRDDLKNISKEHITGAGKLADFIINRLSKEIFEQYERDFPDESIIDRLSKTDKIKFDLLKDMDQENLALIYEMIVDKETADKFRKEGITEDLLDELSWYNEQINFAYGVKHGYIKLSTDFNSLITLVDPRFHFDYDMLLGPDFELYCTQDIYDNLEMNKWQHLLP